MFILKYFKILKFVTLSQKVQRRLNKCSAYKIDIFVPFQTTRWPFHFHLLYIQASVLQNMKVQQNFITNSNKVQEGLNFIVPVQWWKKFLNKNESICSIRQMRSLSQSPLDFLYEVGIIEQHSYDSLKTSKNMKNYVHQKLNSIKKQIKQALCQQKLENQRKRELISDQFLFKTNQIQSQTEDFFLCSPELKQNVIQLFDLGDDSWILITPELYRYIWLKQLENIKDKNGKKLIAIPIVMRKQEIENFNKPIIFNNTRNVEVYFKKNTVQNFVFTGFIQEDLSINELIYYLDDGLFRLFKGYRQENQSLQTNMFLAMSNNSKIYYSAPTQKLFKDLGWQHFQEIKDKKLREQLTNYKLTVFETSFSQENENQNQNTENFILALSSQPRKKRKVDMNIQTCPLESTNMKNTQNRSLPRDMYVNYECQTTQQINQEPHQADSLTNVETIGQERKSRNAINNQSPINQPDFSRIPYPIWKQNHQTQHFVRYAQLKIIVPKIFKPYCDQSTLILKEDGKKSVLPRSCNKLSKIEDELVQNQIEEPIVQISEQPPSESVQRQLQILALQILGIKISEDILDAQKIEQMDLAKQNSDQEIKTCKNEYMDQFDCEQSRQF